MKTTIQFWPGQEGEIDLHSLKATSLKVKGESYHNPLRFLEIFANLETPSKMQISSKVHQIIHTTNLNWDFINQTFMPHINGVNFSLGENIYQPPFIWCDADIQNLAVSFTYNTNAFYRILNNLVKQGLIPQEKLCLLMDQACLILSNLYKFDNYFFIKTINNNFNMYLISRIIELLVGKKVYDSEKQEITITSKSLNISLSLLEEYINYETLEKMAISVGRGVSFLEKYLSESKLNNYIIDTVQTTSFKYYSKPLVIDHRKLLIEKIQNAGYEKNSFVMVAIFDDVTETVDDLLWMQDLLKQYPFFKINLIVNKAQINVNFSSDMLKVVLNHPSFFYLASQLNKQVYITDIYCPLISFQMNLFSEKTREIIDQADLVFVKGLNFFETCQIVHKDTFYSFIVYGPISRKYTGLNDYDSVFAFLPAGSSGYIHNKDYKKIQTLKQIVEKLKYNSWENNK